MNENGQVPNEGETNTPVPEGALQPLPTDALTTDAPPHTGDMPKLAALLAERESLGQHEASTMIPDGHVAIIGPSMRFDTDRYGVISFPQAGSPLFRLEQARALPEVDENAWCEDAGHQESAITSFKDEDRRTMRVVVMRSGELAKQQVHTA